MVTAKYDREERVHYFLHADAPTTGIGNGDWGIEIDTGLVSLFDAENGQWEPQFSLQA